MSVDLFGILARLSFGGAFCYVTCNQGDTSMRARTASKPSKDKVRAHRNRLRKQGLRPLQIWVPDMRSPAFEAEARRQSLAVADSARARDDQDFVDAVSDWGTV